ncbi:uncharacterized protein LOC108159387 isoform X2 [Drosophila miranda]|uniref:uncharacterized protein LOC108159387 isoform X2 n=1 Tax=Drosophila miranda TaxID=7229 RepID=UPI0007E76482|nr:uncharacterized protein LOC108159387 isoform X2 [Drosophila miranda]
MESFYAHILTVVWHLVCNANYPTDATIRYGGFLVDPDDPYSLFQSDSDFLAIFRSTDIGVCKTLKIKGMHEFECVGRNDNTWIITMEYSHLICLNYTFGLVNELAEHCTGSKLGPNRSSALYYANIELVLKHIVSVLNCGLAPSSNILVLIVSFIFLILVVSHWH